MNYNVNLDIETLGFEEIQKMRYLENSGFNRKDYVRIEEKQIHHLINSLKNIDSLKLDVKETIVPNQKDMIEVEVLGIRSHSKVFYFNVFVSEKYEEDIVVRIELYYNNNDEIIQECLKVVKSFVANSSDVRVSVNKAFIAHNGTIDLKQSYQSIKEMNEYSEIFYPYLDVQEMFKQFILSEENILVINGIPGIGKTKFVNLFLKYLLENNEFSLSTFRKQELAESEDDEDNEELPAYLPEDDMIEVMYVKNETILGQDHFWDQTMQNFLPDVVILDDIDHYLTKRTADVHSSIDEQKNKFISHFLSYSDGMFNDTKKTKFIITSNMSSDEIDPALLRECRMFDILRLRALTKQEAQKIWDILCEKNDIEANFEDHFEDSESYISAKLGSAISQLKKMKKRNLTKKHNYILEDGISILETTRKNTENFVLEKKKIGL